MFSFPAKDMLLGLDFCKMSDDRNGPAETNPRCLIFSGEKKNLTAYPVFRWDRVNFHLSTLLCFEFRMRIMLIRH